MNKELSADSTLAHYRIISKIGAGGMGEVYLAQDTKLDRKVALKVLPANVASNQDRMNRFVREAKSAAAVDERDPLFVMLARTWPDYDVLRADSRLSEIVGRLNFPGW